MPEVKRVRYGGEGRENKGKIMFENEKKRSKTMERNGMGLNAQVM